MPAHEVWTPEALAQAAKSAPGTPVRFGDQGPVVGRVVRAEVVVDHLEFVLVLNQDDES